MLRIHHSLYRYPHQLSAGEQQRVATARAIIGERKIICADEPTGNLDEENASVVMDALRNEAQRGSAVLLATHEGRLLDAGDVRINLGSKGRYGVSMQPIAPAQRQ